MIADYLFNQTTAAGSRLCVALVKDPLTSAALLGLVGKTVAEIQERPQILAIATPNVEVSSFGFKSVRSKTSAYGHTHIPAFSLPTKCVYVPLASGVVRHVVLILMDGQATTAKAIRCYQCSAALSGAEATLTRINVSKEDKALIAKLVFAGTPGQQVGDMAQYLGSGPISIPVQQPLDIVEMDASVSGIVTPIMVSQYVFKTVCPSASTIG